MLNVDGRFGLYDKGNKADRQKDSCVHIFRFGSASAFIVRVLTSERGCTGNKRWTVTAGWSIIRLPPSVLLQEWSLRVSILKPVERGYVVGVVTFVTAGGMGGDGPGSATGT